MTERSEAQHWVGFDLGGTKMLAQVYDADLKPLGRERRKTKAAASTGSGLERIQETIVAALAAAGVAPQQLAGIGIGCPGPVDMEAGDAPRSAESRLEGSRRRRKLQEQFDCPVAVLNDVDSGVYAEYRFGAGQGARCVIGVFPGTGVGGGCVYKGEILRGAKTTCMEIGHVQVMPEGPLCGCGRRGCLEAVASRLAIAANAAKAAYRGDAPHLKELSGTDIGEIRSGALAEAIEARATRWSKQIVPRGGAADRHRVAGVVHLLGSGHRDPRRRTARGDARRCSSTRSASPPRKRVMPAYQGHVRSARLEAGRRRRRPRSSRVGAAQVRTGEVGAGRRRRVMRD